MLVEYVIWVGNDREFDESAITSIRSPEYNFWGEIRKTRPRCKGFDNGTPGDACNWYVARVVTDTPKDLLVPEAVFRAQIEIKKAMESTPEYVSFRGRGVKVFD